MSASALDESTSRLGVEAAYSRGCTALIARQGVEGEFEGEMVWNTMILSERVIVGHLVGRPPDEHLRAGIVRQYETTVMPEGCWGWHLEGDPSLFLTTLAYVALRLLGTPPDDPLAARAREWTRLQPCGVLALPTWGKVWLAFLGLYDYAGINPFPPELFLLPRRFPVHPDKLYCHTRAIYQSLAYLYGSRFRADLGDLGNKLTQELYGGEPNATDFIAHRDVVSPTDLNEPPAPVLRALYRLLSTYERFAPRWLRQAALRRCLWRVHLEQRASRHESLSPISGALECLAIFAGDPGDAALSSALEGFERWRFEDQEHGARYAGARSQSWDTAFAIEALTAARPGVLTSAGAGDEAARAAAVERACRYLRKAQLAEELPPPRPPGRSSVAGGWCFSDGSHRWPVSDCTAEALSALLHAAVRSPGSSRAPLERERVVHALEFILARQNRDGGFATYEARRGPRWLERLNPSEMFADCMVEGSYVECTGSALVALSAARRSLAEDQLHPGSLVTRTDEAISLGERFLRASQRDDGSFAGAWGINFTYATWFAIRGLRAAGATAADPAVAAAAAWLISTQRDDGGWGEHRSSCVRKQYVAHHHSQTVMTSWALLGLLEAGYDPSSASLWRGAEWLRAAQLEDGSWPPGSLNGVFFGTGMLHYGLYPAYFPLMAIGRFLAVLACGGS